MLHSDVRLVGFFRTFRLICALLVTGIAACTSPQHGISEPASSLPQLTHARVVSQLPEPSDRDLLQAAHGTLSIGAAQLAGMPHFTPATRPAQRSGEHPQNTGDNDTSGQAGWLINSGAASGDGGIYVAMTAYDDAWVTTPTDGAYNTMYAPTTHGPNGNCIEVVTNYYNGFGTPGITVDQVQFYDFCLNGGQGGFVGAVPMDANFVRDYVRVYADTSRALPRYIAAVMHSSVDNRWHAYLYNASRGQYVDFYDSTPGATTGAASGGWSIFETHFHGGPCTVLPDTSEEGIQVHTPGGWQLLGGSAVSSYSWGTCFSAPFTTPYYSPVFKTVPSVAWTVTSSVAPALSEYARVIRADAPLAYYRLDDTTLTALDSSGSGVAHPGTYGANIARDAGSLLAVESTDGAALLPGGTALPANVITVPASTALQPATHLTVEAWVQETRPNAANTNDLVAYGSRASGLSYTIQILANNTVAAFVTTASGYGLVTSKAVLSPQHPYLIDATYDGKSLALYIDGVLDAAAPTAGVIAYAKPGSADGLSIGAAYASSRPVFAGSLDEVAVYGTTLTPAQIASHWTAGSGVAVAAPLTPYAATVTTDTPLVFYRLDDTGNVAVDSGAHHLNATYGDAVRAGATGLLVSEPTANAATFPGGVSRASAAIAGSGNAMLEPTSAVSLETWIETSANATGTIDLVSYGPQPAGFPYTLQLMANGTVAMFVSTVGGYGFVQSAAPLSLASPHLIDGTYDGTTVRVFIDGVLAGSAPAHGVLSYAKQSPSAGLSIGTALDSSRPAFGGILADVAVYGAALSAARVADHWSAGSGRAIAPLSRQAGETGR